MIAPSTIACLSSLSSPRRLGHSVTNPVGRHVQKHVEIVSSSTGRANDCRWACSARCRQARNLSCWPWRLAGPAALRGRRRRRRAGSALLRPPCSPAGRRPAVPSRPLSLRGRQVRKLSRASVDAAGNASRCTVCHSVPGGAPLVARGVPFITRGSRASRQAARQAAQASPFMARHVRSICAPSRSKISTRPCTLFRRIDIRQRDCVSAEQIRGRALRI